MKILLFLMRGCPRACFRYNGLVRSSQSDSKDEPFNYSAISHLKNDEISIDKTIDANRF